LTFENKNNLFQEFGKIFFAVSTTQKKTSKRPRFSGHFRATLLKHIKLLTKCNYEVFNDNLPIYYFYIWTRTKYYHDKK